MTVNKCLKLARSNRREIEIILADILHMDRANLIAHPEYRLSFFEYIKFLRAKQKLKRGFPLAYILGRKEFFGLDFFVNKNVLIPRPETEMLVEEAIRVIARSKRGDLPAGRQAWQSKFLLVDVGTGSGCIPISIIKTSKHKSIKTIATDISRSALKVARKNAKRHNVDIEFYQGNLLEPIRRKLQNNNDKILFTANLPYLTREWVDSESSIAREPRTALVADEINGLSLYEKLFQQAQKFSCELLCEIDPRQSEDAVNLAKKYFPDSKIEIKKDLAGRDRILEISSR